ncbi:cupin domain-containing protein [Phormidium sp. FACHB-592]|uniref:Cupin domain-containing protein n=1 Tax=Stenomitos frigidus AS-A4 TaxID=2933935 RepID=A0ABV0KQB8_9CYAN|nr:cupin domain-containing protein [Phormidium sp. FACHB-592]MBD2075650.1 cupin domain-containing protein [Phormidium sp. FACHB-592]
MNQSCVIPVVKSPHEYQAYRISPDATNRLAIVFDPATVNLSITYCIEIFDVGGKTPPNRHQFATEMFFVLRGEGIAVCDGKEIAIHAGDTLLVPPTGVHAIRNIGAERLYTITIMVPNEDFAELIRSGVPAELDAEDLAVLQC